jgi:ribose 5-phosphate isomerase B
MIVAIGCDHAGLPLKQDLLPRLREEEEVLDLGTHRPDPVDYPDYARSVARALLRGDADRGILICGSAVGVSVAASKFPGIRAAVCHDSYSARQGVEHDDLNVLCLGARVIGTELAWELVRVFLGARFSGEPRHRRRLAKIAAIEAAATSRPRRSTRSTGRTSRTGSSGPS